MKFGSPDISMWLWLVVILIVFNIAARRSVQKALRRFADDSVLPEITSCVDGNKKKIKDYIIVAVVFLAVISLMRPQWGFKWEEVKREGLDIIIAIDTSKSMLAEDVLPNRLERAKLAIRDLVKKLKGDRVGLIAFSGTAFLQCPLTIDYDGFLLSLQDIDVDTIPVGGTSLSNAIYTAIDSYEGDKNKNKILIIITDGEDLEGGVREAVLEAKNDGISISCVGIGSQSGEIIPVRDDRGKIHFLKDSTGNVIKTRLVEDELERMALETGGMYVKATGAEFGLELIYEKKLSKLEKHEFKSRMEKKYYERFQIFLAVAVFFLFVEMFLGERKNKGKL